MADPSVTQPALAAYPDYVLRPRACEVCSSRENLVQCKGCRVTYYCSHEHEASDLERHTTKCRYMRFNCLLQAPNIQDYWAPEEQNRNMLAKVDIMLHLFPNVAAAELSQRLLRKMHMYRPAHDDFRVDWDKNLQGLLVAAADLIPAIDVRLGRDEEAYEFIYHETHRNSLWLDTERRKRGHSRDFKFPNIFFRDNVVNAITINNRRRSFEEVQKHVGLGHQVLLTLMAIKALRSIQDVHNVSLGLFGRTCVLGNAIPQETVDNICGYLRNDFLEDLFNLDLSTAKLSPAWRLHKIREMRRVVIKCVYETARTNKHIWRLMLDTSRLEARHEFGQICPEAGWDVERMAELVAVRQYQTWMETPGSFDILRRAMAATARWASAWGRICWPIERLDCPDLVDYMPGVIHYHRRYKPVSE